MEQPTCVRQSDLCCCDHYSLPCDGQRRDGHYVQLRAFRCAEQEMAHCDVQLVCYGEQQEQDDAQQEHCDAQRASAYDGLHRSGQACDCCHLCRSRTPSGVR